MVRHAVLAGVVALAAGCSAGDDVPAPGLAALQPDRAGPGQVIEVLGQHLCQAPHTDDGEESLACPGPVLGATLWFGTVAAPAEVADDARATAAVPALGPGPVDVVITVAGRASTALPFEVLAP